MANKKLKELLKESNVWDRNFGDSLPTLKDCEERFAKVNEEDLDEGKVTVGFSEEMGALYITKQDQNNGKSYELKKADIEHILKQYKKFKSKID